MFGQCVLCPTWCWHFWKQAFYPEHPWGLLGLRFCLSTRKISWWHFSKGLIKTHLGKYLFFTLSREKTLCQSLGLDIALSRMARKPSRLALGVWHQEMRFQVLYLVPPQSKESFFFVPLYSNKWNTNPCSFRWLSAEEKGTFSLHLYNGDGCTASVLLLYVLHILFNQKIKQREEK